MFAGAISIASIACSLTTSLDGLQGSTTTTNDASLADVSSDATKDASSSDALLTADAGSDANVSHEITFVQGNAADTGSVSLAAAQEGDAILVALKSPYSSGISVSDNQGDSYTLVVGPYTGGQGTLYMFASFNVKGGVNHIQIDTPDASTSGDFYAFEYSGISTFDVGATGTSTTTGTDGIASSQVTIGAGTELLFAYSPAIGNDAAGTNFIARSTFDGDICEERIVDGPGMFNATTSEIAPGEGDIVLGAFH